MRVANIPIFIPHAGCPHQCVFCNQRSITGQGVYSPTRAKAEIEQALTTLTQEDTVEIAFFGGSFTGIDRGDMIAYLDLAQSYVEKGRVRGIRLSTRPDYIDAEILSVLQGYAVRHIELGVQSLSDRVLLAAGRGHSAKQARCAMEAVIQHGFSLVGQMMVGLPESTEQDEIATAHGIADAGAHLARVYPTVVFSDTPLCTMTKNGEYSPLSRQEAVLRAASVLDVFDQRTVEVIRVGLCATDGLLAGEGIYAAEYHPSLGEMARSEVFYRRICTQLDGERETAHKTLRLFCPRGKASQVIGQKRGNADRLLSRYSLKNIKTVESSALLGYNITYELCGEEDMI